MIKDKNIEEIVKNSFTFSEVMSKLGYHCKGGGSYRSLKKRINILNINTDHFKGKGHGTSKTALKTLEEILVENSSYSNNYSLKKRLINSKILEYKCDICSINT